MEEIKTVKAEVIHQALIMSCLNNLVYYKHLNQIDLDYINQAEQLELLGLTNSKTYKEIRQKAILARAKQCYDYFHNHFDNVIIVPLNEFYEILKKYDLASNTMDNYLGEIPEENIQEILKAKIKLDSLTDNTWSNQGMVIPEELVNVSSGYSMDNLMSHTLIDWAEPEKFFDPYRKHTSTFTRDNDSNTLIVNESVNRLYQTFPIFKAVKNLNISDKYTNILDSHEYLHSITNDRNNMMSWEKTSFRRLKSNDLLIAAPASDIKCVRLHVQIKPEDPFVFQVTDYGVIIFSKWGEEAKELESYG